MKLDIQSTELFDKSFKRLAKKHPSLADDVEKLIAELALKPNHGADLGSNFRKIRLALRSSNRGKSGGARVITHDIILTSDSRKITFVAIYTKAEHESISIDRIKEIMASSGY